MLAGRPKDLDDVRSILLAQEGRLNLHSTRSTLAMLENALGISDLLPAFEGLLEE